jgi:hypothetical protein
VSRERGGQPRAMPHECLDGMVVGSSRRDLHHQQTTHEVWSAHVQASARVMTGGVLSAAFSGAPSDGRDCITESTGVPRAALWRHHACVVDSLRICHSPCPIWPLGLYTNHDFRTKNNILIS